MQGTYQNTALFVEAVGRSITTGTVLALVFLMVSLTIVSYETNKTVRWITISIFVLNLEAMVVFATYSAVPSEFISNIPLVPTQL
jgi:uncharacterized membrane protein YadS